MAGAMNFRSALGGFNRQDVVQYIEYMNHQHSTQVAQLNNQLQALRDELTKAKAAADPDLQARLEAANARCAELEAQLEAANSSTAKTDEELEAYRRAEQAERRARDRAAQIYAQANAVLAEATVKVEAVSGNMNAIAEQIAGQLEASRQQLQEAVSAMYAIRPEEE